MQPNWYKECGRHMVVDMHLPEFPPGVMSRFDTKQFVDHLEKAKVDLVTALFAKCHFGNSYYETRVGHKHSALKSDFLMETASECRKRGIRTLAYYSLTWDNHAYAENPQWRFVDAKGQEHGAARQFKCLCINSPYKDELIIPQLREVLSNYPVDGLWLDVPITYVGDSLCYCTSCRRKWQAVYGVDMSAPLPRAMVDRLVNRGLADLLVEIRALADSIKPGFVIGMNDTGMFNLSRRVKELTEVGTWESQPYPNDWLGHSFAAQALRSQKIGGQIMTVRFHSSWGDMTCKSADQLTSEYAIMVANGLPACGGDQIQSDGTFQSAVYEQVLTPAFSAMQKAQEVLRGAQCVRHAAIFAPAPEDADLPMQSLFSTTRDMPAHVRGAHKMMVESHVQSDVVVSHKVEEAAGYPMIILPEITGYSAEHFAGLRRYVEQGGTLVAAGGALLRNGYFELEDVFGIRLVEAFSGAYFPPIEHFVPASTVAQGLVKIPLQLHGQCFKVLCQGTAELAALHLSIVQPQEGGGKIFRGVTPPQQERSAYSFATMNTFGKGQAVYIAGSIFSTYWEKGHGWLRRFVENVLRQVDQRTPCEIDASGRIEANLMQRGKDLLLNLIHYSFGHQGGPGALATVDRPEAAHEVPCAVRCRKPERVTLALEGKELPFRYDAGLCRFNVPKVEHLAIVRLVGAAE